MEEEMDEFEAMEAEAEELAQKANEARRQPGPQPQQVPNKIRPILRPGQPNPNVVPSQKLNQPQQQQQQKPKPAQAEPEAQPVWVAFYQPEVIGIVNTQSGERIEGFKDEGNAQANARMLNDLNTIIISGGY